MPYSRSEINGMRFILFGAASFWGVVLFVITSLNVIAFCTLVSGIACLYSLYKAIRDEYKPPENENRDNIITRIPKIDTVEPDERPEFNKWINAINNQRNFIQ